MRQSWQNMVLNNQSEKWFKTSIELTFVTLDKGLWRNIFDVKHIQTPGIEHKKACLGVWGKAGKIRSLIRKLFQHQLGVLAFITVYKGLWMYVQLLFNHLACLTHTHSRQWTRNKHAWGYEGKAGKIRSLIGKAVQNFNRTDIYHIVQGYSFSNLVCLILTNTRNWIQKKHGWGYEAKLAKSDP